ncbi:MAG: hypothetical protein M0Z80_05390 [Treponema sp.]|nr:hypothetical protein [Treponema sp.]
MIIPLSQTVNGQKSGCDAEKVAAPPFALAFRGCFEEATLKGRGFFTSIEYSKKCLISSI